MSTKSRYLVCVNEKEHSKTALFYACTKAKSRKAAVDMLYVIDPIDYHTIFSIADVIKEERRSDALHLFEELQKKAESWYDIKPNGIIREGLISEEIIHQVKEDSNIVMVMVGVAEDGSSNNQLLTQLSSEMGPDFHVPLLMVPGNLSKEEIIALNETC